MARRFNGSSDVIHADAGHLFANGVPYSVSAWAKGNTATAAVFSEGISTSTRQVFCLLSDATGSKLRIFIQNSAGSSSDHTGTATAFEATVWHHLCVVASGTTYNSYVDGALDLSAQGYGGTISTTLVGIGAFVRSTTIDFFSGSIAEVATWSRSLSSAEVVSLASGLPASHLAPSHYWPLWGLDSPEPDIGTAAHVAGTLTGTSFATGGRTGRRLLTLA